MLFHETGINNIAKLLGRFYIKWLKIEAEYTSKTNAIIKEAYSIGLERMADNVLDEYNNKLDLVYNDYIAKRTELIYSITDSDIGKDSEEEVELKVNKFVEEFVEENPSFYFLKEFLSVTREDIDLTDKVKKLEQDSNNLLNVFSENGLNLVEYFIYLLDSSEDSDNIKTLLGLTSKYSVESYEEDPTIIYDFIAELESSFNIDFGFKPEDYS